MFAVIFPRDIDTIEKGDYVLCAKNLTSIGEAQSKRKVSGDLVVFQETMEIVPFDNWLFEWEKKNPSCYAQRAIEMAKLKRCKI